MMILLMAACDHCGSESYLLASKLAVKTGDVERLRFLMDQAETYILEKEPGFVGRMIRDAYSLNPYKMCIRDRRKSRRKKQMKPFPMWALASRSLRMSH